MEEIEDKHKITISDLIKSHPEGLTIVDIMNKTGLARHTILARLHNLVGAGNVGVRQIQTSKLHFWKDKPSEKEELETEEVKDKSKIKVSDLLKSHPEGLTIIDIMNKLNLSRHTVLDRLNAFIGEGKVNMKQIQTSKLHFWKDQPDKKPEEPIDMAKIKENVEVKPIQKEDIKQPISKKEEPTFLPKYSKPEEPIDMAKIKEEIEGKLKTGTIKKDEAQVMEQRAPISHITDKSKHPGGRVDKYIKTEIPGFDKLLEKGIPKETTILMAGGAGSGKTTFVLQTLYNHALHGEKCLFMSFEESEEHLIDLMEDFGWNPRDQIKKGNLLIKRFNPFDITRNVEALLLKAKGGLLIDIEPVIFPKGFKPDFVAVDSLTAIASAFTGKEESYRIYIEQLFRFFEKIKSTSFLITETKQIPTIFSKTGVEEFLADGVIVFYNIKRGNIRENAIEILKLRRAKHQKKIVAMQITDQGIVVYPEQEVFGGFGEQEENQG